jgi:hypothetical protein
MMRWGDEDDKVLNLALATILSVLAWIVILGVLYWAVEVVQQ